MGRKKKIETEEVKEEEILEKPIQREVAKFKPTEWAKQKNLDPHLFLYWENQLMGEQEFENIKKKVI